MTLNLRSLIVLILYHVWCIFSPQAYFQHDTTSPKVLSSQNRLGIELKIPTDTTTNPHIVSILCNTRNNLPTFYACQVGTTATTDTNTDSIKRGTKSIQSNFASLMSHVTEVINTNLSSAQKLLVSWHVRSGHFHLKAVQQVIRSGCLGTTPALRAAAKCEPPKYASCVKHTVGQYQQLQIMSQTYIEHFLRVRGSTRLHVTRYSREVR